MADKVIDLDGVVYPYALEFDKPMIAAAQTRVKATANCQGVSVAGDWRYSERGAVASLRRALLLEVKRLAEVERDRERLEIWNQGGAKKFYA